MQDDWQDYMEPTLVSNFWIEKDFKTPGKFVYDCEVEESKFVDYRKECGLEKDKKMMHSMVLLGIRKDEEIAGKVWFLLQNLWKDKVLSRRFGGVHEVVQGYNHICPTIDKRCTSRDVRDGSGLLF